MTADELRSHFNRVFGLEKEWPKTYEVDTETYANCCQDVFNRMEVDMQMSGNYPKQRIRIWLGYNKGLMFKNVELILRNK